MFGIRSFLEGKTDTNITESLSKTTEMSLFLNAIKEHCLSLLSIDDSSYSIVIDEEELKKINLENLDRLFETISTNRKITSINEFTLNSESNVIKMSNNLEQNVDSYKSHSSCNSDVVFFITKEKIVIITKGKLLNDGHVFFTSEDIVEYNQKPTIEHLDQVLIAYESELHSDKSMIKSFFVDDVTINSNSFPKNTLVRDSKDLVATSLSKYLSKNMKEDFKYGKLYNRDNIIYTEDSFGSLVCLEIDCLGTVLNLDGKSTTQFSLNDENTRISQNIDSIKIFINHAIDSLKKTIKLFKIVIFDAREEVSDLSSFSSFPMSIKEADFAIYNSINLSNQ